MPRYTSLASKIMLKIAQKDKVKINGSEVIFNDRKLAPGQPFTHQGKGSSYDYLTIPMLIFKMVIFDTSGALPVHFR